MNEAIPWRLLGATITAALAGMVILSAAGELSIMESVAFCTACPVIATIFTRSGPSWGLYLINGLAVALVLALTAGNHLTNFESEPGTPYPFLAGFVIALPGALAALALGGIMRQLVVRVTHRALR